MRCSFLKIHQQIQWCLKGIQLLLTSTLAVSIIGSYRNGSALVQSLDFERFCVSKNLKSLPTPSFELTWQKINRRCSCLSEKNVISLSSKSLDPGWWQPFRINPQCNLEISCDPFKSDVNTRPLQADGPTVAVWVIFDYYHFWLFTGLYLLHWFGCI